MSTAAYSSDDLVCATVTCQNGGTCRQPSNPNGQAICEYVHLDKYKNPFHPSFLFPFLVVRLASTVIDVKTKYPARRMAIIVRETLLFPR